MRKRKSKSWRRWRRNRIAAGATEAEVETAAALLIDEMKGELDVVCSYEI
jgi:hypothetical protein